MLIQRVIATESKKDLQDKIRKVLEVGVVISNVEDISFNERYGI